ncbi:MAG: pseudouridine synthase, partial [Spirochaetia bacterium]|nr:pseudouridine synthase [Spirochaetia bacterium]
MKKTVQKKQKKNPENPSSVYRQKRVSDKKEQRSGIKSDQTSTGKRQRNSENQSTVYRKKRVSDKKEQRSGIKSDQTSTGKRQRNSENQSTVYRKKRIPEKRELIPEVHTDLSALKKKKKITPDRELAVKNLQKSILEGSRKKKDEQFPMRINRYLAVCGLGSRRQVESYVTRGRVSLNGKKISGLDAKVNFNDTVQVDGKTIRFDGVFTYLAMNKPPGYTVSKRRFKNDRTIYELLDETQHHVKYAGRLDRDSRGLLILSDDGNFITAVTHPSRRITKKYHVTVDHLTEMNEIQREFSRGIYDEGELLKAVRVRILDKEKKKMEWGLG